jgi:hypothetical protein
LLFLIPLKLIENMLIGLPIFVAMFDFWRMEESGGFGLFSQLIGSAGLAGVLHSSRELIERQRPMWLLTTHFQTKNLISDTVPVLTA